MDPWTAGADVGTMVTGLSALTAAYVWSRGQVRNWKQQRIPRSLRNWGGYIDVNGLGTWPVRPVEDPTSPTAMVVLEVLDGRDGDPDVNLAQNMRQRVIADGMLSRVPTSEEYDFLIYLRKDRGYGKGQVVR